jgi:hypothetical protein
MTIGGNSLPVTYSLPRSVGLWNIVEQLSSCSRSWTSRHTFLPTYSLIDGPVWQGTKTTWLSMPSIRACMRKSHLSEKVNVGPMSPTLILRFCFNFSLLSGKLTDQLNKYYWYTTWARRKPCCRLVNSSHVYIYNIYNNQCHEHFLTCVHFSWLVNSSRPKHPITTSSSIHQRLAHNITREEAPHAWDVQN